MPDNTNRDYRFGLLIVPLLACSAQAGDEDAISRCARIASAGDRILCLENALRDDFGDSEVRESPIAVTEVTQDTAATAEKAVEPNVEIATDAEGTRKQEVEQFGLTEKQKKAAPVTSIEVAIVAVSKNAYGKLIFTMENGQVWQQTDKRSLRYKDLPIDATIRNGASGSHFMQPLDGGVAVRVKRTR